MIANANWPKLGYFNLHSNQISSKGALKLISRYSSALWRFDLDFNLLQDDVVDTILSLRWERLSEVHLGNHSLIQPATSSLTPPEEDCSSFSNPNAA